MAEDEDGPHLARRGSDLLVQLLVLSRPHDPETLWADTLLDLMTYSTKKIEYLAVRSLQDLRQQEMSGKDSINCISYKYF